MKRAAFWLIVLGLPMAAGEALLRVAARRVLGPLDERHLSYRHDPVLGWFPKEGAAGTLAGSRPFTFRHNRHGFRDQEIRLKRGRRLAFVGDSFVWGYDANDGERFSDRLRDRWPQGEVLNLGVSGYGTDQELLLLQRFADELQPDVVILIYSGNDPADNATNYRYEAYKPYFVERGGRLAAAGMPVPRSVYHDFGAHPVLFASYWARLPAYLWWRSARPPVVNVPDASVPLLGAIADLLASREARFAVGLTYEDTALRQGCEARGIPVLSLAEAQRYPGHGRHWTPRGHLTVAQQIRAFLDEAGWMGAGSAS